MNPTMNLRVPRLITLAGALAVLAGCSGGGGNTDSVPGTSGDFLVLRTTPPNNGKLFLNEPIRMDFSNRVDLSTADLNTVAFQVFDLNGNPLTERPAGTFSVGRSAGDDEAGRQLVFTPRFPTNNTFTDGGFKPGRLYVVQLVAGSSRNNTTLRDVNGRPLSQPVTFEFRTADGTTPSQLFSDTRAGGPRRVSFQVSPQEGGEVALNRFSQEPVEVRLTFDQPLNPSDENVPVNIAADPTQRSGSNRGRVFMEYDDPSQQNRWIPATVDLEVNTREGSAIVLRPVGVLPNNADIRVIVENTVEDMSGESNVSDASYNRIFGTFRTQADFDPQYDAIVETFVDSSDLDLDAPFLEPAAELEDGQIRASFNFDGGTSRLTYRPQQRQVILNTDFTQITPVNNPPINVSGGVFTFSEVIIDDNVRVEGVGTNPMVWLVTGDFTVNGVLAVDGGAGARVDTLNSANFPTPGGIGVCGGGNGGRGSPNAQDRSELGEPGFGPGQRPNGGGEPGRLSCSSSCNRGSAGGGGSLFTQGDPWYPPNPTAQRWPQTDGFGGEGCTNRSLPGGQPGPQPFTDSRDDNNFWGSAVNLATGVRIRGELLAPVAGAGGGGGGDRSANCRVPDPTGFISDNKGGGGGGGAGILIVQALGTIRIGRSGLISAVGGHGGGGEQAGSNNEGGGGGGGSGGMVVLMAGQGFRIAAHGTNALTNATYGELDYSFAISADGGIGTQGRFGGTEISNKYSPIGTAAWNSKPTGGFGGMGIVQLLVPPGDDDDGTGNRLDDNIVFVDQNNMDLPAARKVELLAWRGWPDETGQRTDDLGNPIDLGNEDGDIRPSPILLPAPFGAVSRARSRWIDLGFARRERFDTDPGNDVPRSVIAPAGMEPKPDYGDEDLGFAGTSKGIGDPGYIAFDPQSGAPMFPVISLPGGDVRDIESVTTNKMFEGGDAYELALVPGQSLGTLDHRYSNYRLQILDDGDTPLADFRILGHQSRFVFLEPSATFPANGAKCRVLAKFFEVLVDGQTGLGPTYNIDNQGNVAPVANARIGFRFSANPNADPGDQFWPNGTDPNESLFEFDLTNPDFLQWLDDRRTSGDSPTFVQWDITFNTRYHPTNAGNDSGVPLDPEMPLPALDYLVLPYRF